MVALARFFDWRGALAIVCERKVKPATFLKWHRTGFKLFWRWKSRYPGRPPLPKNLRELAIRMAHDNPTWGEQRIASELSLKLGIRVAPRTVAKYLDFPRPRGTTGGLRWSTFLRNHAKGVVICDPACDFFVSITATFRVLYVFVAMEIGSRRILHTNVTAHPTADWTIQQFREFLAPVHRYHFLIRDRDGIFLPRLDAELSGFGVHVLKTPPRTPTAIAYCERPISAIRRECLDYLIPINERHLQTDRQRVRMPLQSRSPSLFIRTWNSGGAPSHDSGRSTPTQAARRLPRPSDTCSRRTASRILAGEGGRPATDGFFAQHRPRNPVAPWRVGGVEGIRRQVPPAHLPQRPDAKDRNEDV
jgi:hypothetical protein